MQNGFLQVFDESFVSRQARYSEDAVELIQENDGGDPQGESLDNGRRHEHDVLVQVQRENYEAKDSCVDGENG